MLFDKLLKPKEKPAPQQYNTPTSPLLFKLRIEPYGTNYECILNPRIMRQSIIARMKPGDPVGLVKGKWESETLFLVLNLSGADIASFPEPFYRYMNDMIKDLQICGTVTQTNPLSLNLEIHGEYKKKWDLKNPTTGKLGKEYTYAVNTPEEYMRLPVHEIPCKLTLVGDTYTVTAGRKMVGTLYPKNTERLTEMLGKYDCVTTVRLEPRCYNSKVLMELRF